MMREIDVFFFIIAVLLAFQLGFLCGQQ